MELATSLRRWLAWLIVLLLKIYFVFNSNLFRSNFYLSTRICFTWLFVKSLHLLCSNPLNSGTWWYLLMSITFCNCLIMWYISCMADTYPKLIAHWWFVNYMLIINQCITLIFVSMLIGLLSQPQCSNYLAEDYLAWIILAVEISQLHCRYF